MLHPARSGRAPGYEVKYAWFDPDAKPAARVDSKGTFSGYAALFDQPDQSGDVITRGAFAASLKRRPAKQVKLLWQHDPDQPIGVWFTLREDDRGLWAEGRLIKEVRQGREAAALLRAGALDGLSIGYQTIKAEAAPSGRRLLEIDLWEVSLVTFPMMENARAAPDSDDDVGDGDCGCGGGGCGCGGACAPAPSPGAPITPFGPRRDLYDERDEKTAAAVRSLRRMAQTLRPQETSL